MKTKTYKVYKFNELTKEQKEKAIKNLWDINVRHNWDEWVLDEEKSRLEELGYSDIEIYYSGFYSQGDGASFTATGNIEKLVEKASHKKDIELITFHRLFNDYCPECSMMIDIDYNTEKLPDYRDTLEDNLLKNARNEAKAIYKHLQNEYDYLTSDDAIIETILANDYDFREDGNID
jgi:hypothetical protein